MKHAWLKAITEQPIGLVRLKWLSPKGPISTDWYDATDECLDILNDLRDKLEGSLGHGETFALEIKEARGTAKEAERALDKIFSAFRENNNIKMSCKPLKAKDPNPKTNQREPVVGYVRLSWHMGGDEPFVTTEWIPNTHTNLQMIAHIRSLLEEYQGHGTKDQFAQAFTYDFNDGYDERVAARNLTASLRQKSRDEPSSRPDNLSNDP